MRGRYSLSMTNKGSSWPGLESGFLWALQWISYSAGSSSSSMPCLAPPSSPEEASIHYCATSKMVRIFKVSAPLYYILTVKGFHFKYDSGLSGCVCIPKLWGSLKKCIQSSQIHSVLSIKSGFFLRFPRAAFFSSSAISSLSLPYKPSCWFFRSTFLKPSKDSRYNMYPRSFGLAICCLF